jgi:hypothetical protein
MDNYSNETATAAAADLAFRLLGNNAVIHDEMKVMAELWLITNYCYWNR